MEYRGSTIFHPIAVFIELPLDQINFLMCQLFLLVLSLIFRYFFNAAAIGSAARHFIAVAFGLGAGLFCFGSQIWHIFAQCGLCYFLMAFAPPDIMHMMVLVTAMGYLSVMHIWRMIYDYGGYTLDVTGPLMICTQKMTSMAFSLHDGKYKQAGSLSKDQQYHSIAKLPTLLPFTSYIFYFQGLLAGPLCFYNDYIRFIEGKNFEVAAVEAAESRVDVQLQRGPSPIRPVMIKLLTSFLATLVFLGPSFSVTKNRNTDPNFVYQHSFLYRIGFLILSVGLARSRYYFAWKLGEAVNNASGLGFNGYDGDGNAKWDLVDNVQIRKLEFSTSLKGIIENWNIQTQLWLRRICYDRASVGRIYLTYILSAIWHGFYPGYYFTFIGASFFTMAARNIRRTFRPIFQTTSARRIFYDILTWMFAHLALAYLIVPFTILQFKPTFFFYHHSMCWFLHILVLFVLLFFPSPLQSQSNTASNPAVMETSISKKQDAADLPSKIEPPGISEDFKRKIE